MDNKENIQLVCQTNNLDQSNQSPQTTQTVQPTQTTQPTQTDQLTQPTQTDQLTQPTQTTQTDQLTQPTQTTQNDSEAKLEKTENKNEIRQLLVQKYFIENKILSEGETFDKARKFFYSRNIKTSYDVEAKNRRIIFSYLPNKNKNMDSYTQECNGLILEAGTWKILTYPPNILFNNIDTNVCNNYLTRGLYNIYKAEDGTCFNLYYYNNKWCISTSKGYEMNTVLWNSELTYQQIIEQILKKYKHTWDSFCSSLNKNNSYSFGFKHPEFHPFWEGKTEPIMKLWFIQSVNLNTEDKFYLWANDKKPPIDIPLQEICLERIHNIKDLYRNVYKAYNNFIKYNKCLYGYILRSNNPSETGLHSNLLLESSLMRLLRKSWYDNKIVKFCNNNKQDRKKIIPLFAYLDNNSKSTFLQLYPIYKKQFDLFDTKINKLVNNIYSLYNETELKNIKEENLDNNQPNPLNQPNQLNQLNQDKQTKTYKDALKIDEENKTNQITNLNKEEKINYKFLIDENIKEENLSFTTQEFYKLLKLNITIKHSIEFKKIIREFICDNKFVNILYNYIYNV